MARRTTGGLATLTRCDLAPEGYIIAWRATSSALWRDVLDRVRGLPKAMRFYLPDETAWFVDELVIERLASCFDNFTAAIEGGLDAAPVGHSMPREVVEAFTALYVLPGAPFEVVQAVYRVLSKRLHPDLGGDHRAMAAINAAYELVEAWDLARRAAS